MDIHPNVQDASKIVLNAQYKALVKYVKMDIL